VFHAGAVRQAIVDSSRPGAPCLMTSTTTLAGKPVTVLVYPGGSTLYLYEHDELVFYVGTQSKGLARKVVAAFS